MLIISSLTWYKNIIRVAGFVFWELTFLLFDVFFINQYCSSSNTVFVIQF